MKNSEKKEKMLKKGENVTEEKNNKKAIIIAIIIIILGLVLASVPISRLIKSLFKSGTVSVDDINVQITDTKGEEITDLKKWQPGDVNKISWKVKNLGTSAIYTRNTLQIYWNDASQNSEQVIYLYPANMTKRQVLEDIRTEEKRYAIPLEFGEITVENDTKKGIEYKFAGDSLDGSKTVEKGTEVNYNSEDFDSTTDDQNSTEDDIAFNILLAPQTSYLYSKKALTIRVVTEAMQYNEKGKEEWQIVDEQTIN